VAGTIDRGAPAQYAGRRDQPGATQDWSVTMNASERRMREVSDDIRTLQDDELCTVTGGATMLDYEGTPVVAYSLLTPINWPKLLYWATSGEGY
jgi:hypothetical protein